MKIDVSNVNRFVNYGLIPHKRFFTKDKQNYWRASSSLPANKIAFYLGLDPSVRKTLIKVGGPAFERNTGQFLGDVLGALEIVVTVNGNFLNYR